jgi:hypothetical protein
VTVTLERNAAFIPNMQADAAKGVDAWLRAELAPVAQEGAKSVPIGAARKQPRGVSG